MTYVELRYRLNLSFKHAMVSTITNVIAFIGAGMRECGMGEVTQC